MGSYDRDYMRGNQGGSGYRDSYSNHTHRLIWILMGVNAAVFLAAYFAPEVFFRVTADGVVTDSRAGGLSLSYLREGQIWRIFTYPFIHGHLLHLLMNMALLYFIGRHVLNAKGVTQFVVIYVLGSVIGAALQIAFVPSTYLVGASASIIALVSAFCWMRPKDIFEGYFMFVIPMRMRFQTLAFIVLGFDVLMFVISLGGESHTAWMAHIGGWLYGWIHMTYLVSGRLQVSAPKTRKTRNKSRGKTVPYTRRSENPNIIEAEFTDGKPDYNAILDKINREGMSALTEEERRILEQASESMKGKNTP